MGLIVSCTEGVFEHSYAKDAVTPRIFKSRGAVPWDGLVGAGVRYGRHDLVIQGVLDISRRGMWRCEKYSQILEQCPGVGEWVGLMLGSAYVIGAKIYFLINRGYILDMPTKNVSRV